MYEIFLLIVGILLSGFFSGIEIAFMSISNIRIKYLVKNNIKNSELLERLRKDPQKLLILILLGNNIVNIGSSAIATSISIKIFGDLGVGIATGIMTFLILIFGEITPKAYCTQNAESVALKVSPFILFLSKVFSPLVFLFNYMTFFINKIFGSNVKLPLITEDEVKNIIDLGEEEGSIKASEKEMINNVFRFDDITVGSVMVPRPDIFALKANEKVVDVKKRIFEEGFSRIPVYDGSKDKIVGILFVKDLLRANDSQKIKELVRPAFFVPETKMINKLFQEMNQRKTHLSMVVDEHGTITGLITIEDLVEEIVGEIYDETDEVRHQFKKINDRTFLVEGDTELKRINRKLDVSLHGNVHKTISAFVLDKLGRIPKKGDKITMPKCIITIEEIKGNRIELVNFKIK